ncbi:MAG: DUF2190 family protein [Acidobacteria bacterium]|nr:DUF2190 family protein [Acidobacteriota bacterium]
MANISRYVHEGKSIDYTPAAAVAAGNIIQVGSLCAFSPEDIAASVMGAVAVEGVIRSPFVGGIVGDVGNNVWWDANATPYGGSADGACTLSPSAGDWWVGTLIAATSATGATCDVALNQENPNQPAFQGKTHILSAIDVTLVAATHSGGVVHIDAAVAKTVTLPVGVVGMDYVIVNDCDDGILLTVDLNGTEIVAGANMTCANGQTMKNTAATAKRGDYIHLVCNVAATSWRCVAKSGTWVGSAA